VSAYLSKNQVYFLVLVDLCQFLIVTTRYRGMGFWAESVYIQGLKLGRHVIGLGLSKMARLNLTLMAFFDESSPRR